MSSPNQARRVTAQIFFQDADITGSMRPYFLSATYTDKEADGTDDLQLKLQDRDDIWLKKWLADAIDAAASAGSLSASSKAKTDGAAKSYKVTAKSGLNVRSGPSTSYGKYGALVCGAELQVEGIENGWAKVSYNGKTAYVSASYIKESGGGGGDASAAAPASASGAGFKISAVFVRENWVAPLAGCVGQSSGKRDSHRLSRFPPFTPLTPPQPGWRSRSPAFCGGIYG